MKTYTFEDGKYRIDRSNTGHMSASRYGDPWRDLAGDNLVAVLLDRIDDLEEQVKDAAEYIKGHHAAYMEALSRLQRGADKYENLLNNAKVKIGVCDGN